ncbi:unnamed protein product [Cladocopium goreaui]|uniref:Uncharacterized protein n=1 Tax=Cladocopium goreaui TaxID=2562237 RepID=A0A9P1G080_9DINO|nr:unnamed protein product [Cladocopium goreaui]
MPCMACHAGWLLGLAILWPAENAKIPDPLALFSKAGNSWPARPCRMFAGVSPAKSDGKFIFTPSDSDLVVWNDVSCSSGAATAELRVTRTFQEAVDAIAFLPPKTIVIASKRSWHGMNYATLRFYNAGDLGHSTAPMFTRRFDGHITSLMVLGNDLLFAATFTKEGEHFIHCLSNVLTERKKSSQTLKALAGRGGP